MCMCLFAMFCNCTLFFGAMFSKVFPHLFPFISCGLSPFPKVPHFPHLPLLVFSVAHGFLLVSVITMFLVFQGGSPIIDGFSIIPFSKASHVPLYFCCFNRRGAGANLQI